MTPSQVPAVPLTADDQTLVTCLFDLELRERIGRRGMDFYWRHGRWLLAQPVPLVVYADPELAARISGMREANGLAHLTRVIALGLEQLPLYEAAKSATTWPTILNGDPLKCTAMHQLVEWSKFELLRRGIALNPFATEYFAWVDFGLGHIAEPPETFPRPTRRVTILQMKATAPAETADPLAFLGYERGRLAAGLIRGHATALLTLAGAFETLLAATLKQNFRPNEQMVLALLTVLQPSLMDFYYGDYRSILCNWDHIRRDPDTVLGNIHHCHRYGCFEQAARIDRALLSSINRGLVALDRETLARFLDMAFVAAWNSAQFAQARQVQSLFLANCAHTQYERDNRARISRNFAFQEPPEPPASAARAPTAGTRPAPAAVPPASHGRR